MEYRFIIYLFSASLIYMCCAEYTADMVYEFLSNRLDNVFFDIRNLRRDIQTLNDQEVSAGSTSGFVQFKKNIDDMFETFRSEINDIKATTQNLEKSVLKKLDDILREKLETRFTDKKVEIFKKSSRVELSKYLKSLSAEKQFIRQITNGFENRVNAVELKMMAFENASWKGEKGESGLPGLSGVKGSKGERGSSMKGQKGIKGELGTTGRPGVTGEKGAKGETGYKGRKGDKGVKGSRQTEKNVYFTATLTKILPDVGPKEIVVFDTLKSEAGGAYSTVTGKFTAPVSGTYLFLFNAETSGLKNKAHVNLVLDGSWKAISLAEAWHDGHDATSGNSAVLHVRKGQSVWIETARFTRYEIRGWRTSFSGVLLHAS